MERLAGWKGPFQMKMAFGDGSVAWGRGQDSMVTV